MAPKGVFRPILAIFIVSLTFVSTQENNLSPSPIKEESPAFIFAEAPSENFENAFFIMAQKYTTTHNEDRLTQAQVDELSQFSRALSEEFRDRIVKVTKVPIKVSEIRTILPEMQRNGTITGVEFSSLKLQAEAMQEAYTKFIIKLFRIQPEEFDTTPEIFCSVFGVCQYTTPETTTLSEKSTTTLPREGRTRPLDDTTILTSTEGVVSTTTTTFSETVKSTSLPEETTTMEATGTTLQTVTASSDIAERRADSNDPEVLEETTETIETTQSSPVVEESVDPESEGSPDPESDGSSATLLSTPNFALLAIFFTLFNIL